MVRLPQMAKDDMRFIFDGKEVKRNMRYEIETSIYTVPAAFSMDFSTRRSVGEMRQAFPPNTPFKLFCGDSPLFTGTVDGYEVACSSKGSTINFFGRDPIGKLVSNDVPHDIHVSGKTYYDLLVYALEQNGVTNPTIVGSNEANRKAQSRNPKSTYTSVEVNGVIMLIPTTTQTTRGSANPSRGGNGVRYEVKIDEATDVISLQAKTAMSDINSQAVAKTGQSWFEFLRSYYDKAGLFLWSGARGEYILSTPDIHQKPSYRLLCLYEGLENNVISSSMRFDTKDMHAFCNTYGRAGGTKGGRLTLRADASNPDMIALGFSNIRSAKDDKISSQKHAVGLAKRKLAEECRKGIHFQYRVKGHLAPLINGGKGVWVPDTIVELVDDELELQGAFYISGVRYSRDAKGGTFTDLTLMRPQDLALSSTE